MTIDTLPTPAGARPAARLGRAGPELHVSTELRALGFLCLVALLLRFPFFFPAVIDWDESTFVLVGQSLLDGHLPYVELWALKPPLAFAFFAVVIAIFGKSLVAVRLAGTACVVVSAFLLYLTASRLWGRRPGILAGTLCVAAASLLPSGQATMTEHVALVPLTWALFLLMRKGLSVGTSCGAGILLSVATLVRLNMAYVVVFVGLYVLIASLRDSPLRAVQCAAAYAGGGGLVLALTWLPYVLSGQQELWWTSVVTAPLSYASSQSSAFENLVTHSKQGLGMYRDDWELPSGGSSFIAFVWLGAAGGVAALVRRWRPGTDDGRGVMLLVLFTVGVGLGIVTSGRPYPHHVIQLAPFAAMLAALFVDQFSGVLRSPALLIVGLLLVVSLKPVADGYETVMMRALAHETLRYGAAYEIAAYLRRENAAGRPVYLLTDHIAYWLSNSRPPTRLTAHPSNIAQRPLLEAVVGKGASTEDELRNVFRQRPEFVVTRERVWYLRGGARQLLETILDDRYLVTAQIEGRRIYRIKSSS